jgi:hypothetical protein
MDFDTNASNIIHVIFQMKVIFQHNYARLNEKCHPYVFCEIT